MNIRDIIRACGGAAAIAETIGTTSWAIQKWPLNGIPEHHWSALITLGNGRVSAELLHAANEEVRAA